ncbi:MAG: CRISPR-associated endoribonuclease Cas6 [Anaerolineae bacterium]|nr:CRISPR-associated endoribonuclease Cas6 [Anaerolineae bacterium]
MEKGIDPLIRDVPSLYSVVLRLAPLAEAEIEATVGHRAHAAFLDAIRKVSPDLSAALHDPEVSVRPFTVSPLWGTSAREGKIRISLERTYWLRVTLLVRPLYERLMEVLLADERPQLRLGAATFLIQEALTTPGSHPWAGYASWEELARRAQPERELTLEFVSPTAFSFGEKSWGRHMVVLPLPELVFGSLARTWNAYAPSPVQVEARALEHYAEEHVVVQQIAHLQTRMLNFSGRPQIGFVGRVTYGLMGENDIARIQMAMLADFAFYGGVGYKRAMGMGQCRRVG